MSLRLVLGAAAVALLAACGGAPAASPAPWAAAHPDPRGMHFTDAQGLCSITVRYPNDAPGEIDWKGDQFIQRSRSSGDAGAAAAPVVGRSADWTVHQPSDTELLLVTPGGTYGYRAGSHCGSNSAAPT